MTTWLRRFSGGTLAVCLLPMLLAAGLMAPPARGEDRALLIGVGKYADPSNNLPGIDLDVEIMQEVTRLLQFRPEQVKVMADREVTLRSVEQAVDTWLTNRVSAGDRVLIYYSGHGSQVPDENGDEKEDHADEVLTMHDLRVVRRNGKPTLEGVLVDDNFQTFLKRIPSQNVLVLIDSCHSGTATKNISLDPRHMGLSQGKSKFFHYDGMPTTSERSFAIEHHDSARSGYLSIAASHDDERSLASPKGSFFTLGVRESIRKASQGGRDLTPEDLAQEVGTFIKANMPAAYLFHPQLSGDQKLSEKPLRLASLERGGGPVRSKLEKIVQRSGPLRVASNKPSLPVGDLIEFEIEVPRAGYLNVIDVGPDDEPTILFPNRDHPNNGVRTGKIRLGSQQMNFEIRAAEPTGPSLVVAVLTEEPIDLRSTASGPRSNDGSVTSLLSTLTPLGLKTLGDRSLGPESREKVLAGKIEIVVFSRSGR